MESNNQRLFGLLSCNKIYRGACMSRGFCMLPGTLLTISISFCSVTQVKVVARHLLLSVRNIWSVLPVDPPRGMLSTVPQAAGRPTDETPATPKGERAASTPGVLVEAARRTAAAAAMVVAAGSTSFLQLLLALVICVVVGSRQKMCR